MEAPEIKSLLSDEHFSVDGTLLQAWAFHASLELPGVNYVGGSPLCPPEDNRCRQELRHQRLCC